MKKRTVAILCLILSCFALSGCYQTPPKKPALVNDDVRPSQVEPAIQEVAPAASSPGTLGWYVMRSKDHQTPTIDRNLKFKLSDYQAYYLGSRDKLIFLTFDEGYENGYTATILDTLKSHQVPAAFFVTEPYITSNPLLIKRMVDEGHLVGNHSKTHPSMPSLTWNQEKFDRELLETAKAFKDLTGQDMPLYFRPPKGEYNEASLKMTSNLGYKTVFWSFAYEDWLVDKQPQPEKSLDLITSNFHPGEIMLLHAVSKTNNDILGRVITEARSQGYRFASLHEMEMVN